MNTVKVLLMGCGKSTFINKVMGNEFEHRYLPTYGISVNVCIYNDVSYEFTEVAGQEKFVNHNLGDVDFNIVLIFYDVGSKTSYKSIENHWVKRLINIKYNMLKIIGNKSDMGMDVKFDGGISVKNNTVEELMTTIL